MQSIDIRRESTIMTVMERVRTILPKVLLKRGLARHAISSSLILQSREWLHSALPHMAQFIEPATFSDGILTIRCEHSIAVHECHGASAALLTFLEREFPEVRIVSIRVIRS